MFFVSKNKHSNKGAEISQWLNYGMSSIPGWGKRFFSFRNVKTGSVAETAFYSMSTGGSFTVGKGLKRPGSEANH